MTDLITDPIAAIEDEHRWVAPARITVTGPDGWYPTERVDVVRADGAAAVWVETWPVDAIVDVETIAASHAEPFASVDGWQDRGVLPAVVLGVAGLTRAATWTDDGATLRARFDYAIVRGRAHVIAEVVRGGDERVAAQARAVAASVTSGSPAEIDEAALPLRDSPADFAVARQAWTTPAPPAAAESHVITHEEAFGAARHYGVTTLPAADPRVLDSLDLAGQAVATGVAWRSLRARGAERDGPLREALELAVGHDLVVQVESPAGSLWFACRPDRMVRVEPTTDGLLSLSVHDTVELAALVATDGQARASSAFRLGDVIAGHEAEWSEPSQIGAALVSLLPD